MTNEPGDAVQSNEELERIRADIGAIVSRLDVLIEAGEDRTLAAEG